MCSLKRALPALCIILAGCGADSGAMPGATRPEAAVPGEASCAPESSVIVNLKLDRLHRVGDTDFHLLNISDSRCPLGVTCVWQGEVTVDLEIRSGSRAAEQVKLVLTPGRDPHYSTVSGLSLRLLKVDPYPSSGVTPPRESFTARVVSCKI